MFRPTRLERISAHGHIASVKCDLGGDDRSRGRDVRWAIITPTLSRGPFANRSRSLAVAFAAQGITVDVLFLEHHGAPVDTPNGVRTLPLHGRASRSVRQIARYLHYENPDVVLSISFMMNVPCIAAAMFSRYDGILLVNEAAPPTATGIVDYPDRATLFRARVLYNTLYRRVDGIVCVSEWVKSALEELGLRQDIRRKLTVIYNPVSLGRSPNPTNHDPPPEYNREPIFLCLGRLVARKRVELSISAFSQFFARHGVGNLVIAGDGPETSTLRNLASELGVENRVYFLGYVEEPLRLLSRATFLLHLAHSEGFGLAVAEALATATPVIVAQGSGGAEEIVGAGGVVVPSRPADVSLAMEIAVTDEVKLEKMREEALLNARRFAPTLVADKWITLARSIRK